MVVVTSWHKDNILQVYIAYGSVRKFYLELVVIHARNDGGLRQRGLTHRSPPRFAGSAIAQKNSIAYFNLLAHPPSVGEVRSLHGPLPLRVQDSVPDLLVGLEQDSRSLAERFELLDCLSL